MMEKNEAQPEAAANKSDFSRAFSEDGERKTHIGGQALLEGIMMRGKFNWAVAVREPDGNIYLEEHDLASGRKKNSWLHWPLVRGCTALVESLGLGFKALAIAAEHAFDDEEDEKAAKAKEAEPEPAEAVQMKETVQAKESAEKEGDGESTVVSFISGFAMVIGVILGLVIFIVAPAFITNLILGDYNEGNALAWNIVDGLIRIAIFLLYLWLIGRMEDIKRMFMYHGAEHKTIHCYEHRLPLTVENARKFPRLHVRCGTAFLLMVLIIAIIVYTIVPLNAIIGALGIPDGPAKFAVVVATRVILLPLIAGISYEITVKWAGSHPDNALVKVVLWPGMQMQYLTTNEPGDEQLECAIAAMNMVLEREEAEAAKAAEESEVAGTAEAVKAA